MVSIETVFCIYACAMYGYSCSLTLKQLHNGTSSILSKSSLNIYDNDFSDILYFRLKNADRFLDVYSAIFGFIIYGVFGGLLKPFIFYLLMESTAPITESEYFTNNVNLFYKKIVYSILLK